MPGLRTCVRPEPQRLRTVCYTASVASVPIMDSLHRLRPLSAWIPEFAGRRILVVGDLMLDEFIWGRVSRISPEAPVPVVQVSRESVFPGGAANVARNLREFTGEVAVLGRAGADAAGARLLGLLAESGLDASATMVAEGFRTSVKTRIIARSQQVVRVDRESIEPLTEEQFECATRAFDAAIAGADAVVVADYGKGFLSQPFADHICRTARERGKILTVDPHPRTSLVWRGATAIKPNRAEAFLAAGVPASEPVDPPLGDQALFLAAERLLERWETRSLLITLGERGMLLFSDGEPPHHTPARTQEVFDVSGAGDTAIAVMTLGLAAGASPLEAAELANAASGVVVGKIGTATVTAAELVAACTA
jgi:D-glycero-beta-D-manno-heptose-7-phosphate kinase